MFSGTTVSFGADGAGVGTTSGYALSTTGGASGLTQHGVAINLYNVGGVIVGSTATTAGGIDASNTVFTVSTTNTGVVTLTQFSQIDHTNTDPSPTGAPFTDHIISLTDGSITLTRNETVVDKDGDSVTGSASVGIGANLHFVDDGPTISLADRGEPQLTVDETNFARQRHAELCRKLQRQLWRRRPGSELDHLCARHQCRARQRPDRCRSPASRSCCPVNGSGVVEGHVGDAANAAGRSRSASMPTAMSRSTRSAPSFTARHRIPDTSEGQRLAADNLVTLTATAHDFDGDTASATINIGANLHLLDDGPTVSASGTEATLTVDETNFAVNDTQSFATAFTQNFGNDGPAAAGSSSYSLGVNARRDRPDRFADRRSGSPVGQRQRRGRRPHRDHRPAGLHGQRCRQWRCELSTRAAR